MVKRKIVKAANYLKESLQESGVKVDKLIVFGSQARGTARKDSDIDIVIISRDFKDKDIFARAKLTGNAHWEVMQKILIPLDLVAMTPEEFESGNSLIAESAKDGEIIFS